MYEYDFCEYAVEKKKEGSYLAKTVVIAVLLAALVLVAFTVIAPVLGMGVGLIVLVVCGVLAWYLSRFTAIEYEYTQTSSTIDFAEVYSKQYRKEKLSLDVKKSAQRIAPYDEKEAGGRKVYDFRSSANISNAYMIIFDDEGTKSVVLFDATKRLVNNLRHQTPSIVTLSSELPEE